MKKVKTIVSIILVIILFCLTGTGCSKKKDLSLKNVENYPVNVSQLDIKIFKNQISSTFDQQELQKNIIEILSDKSISDISDFVVNYSSTDVSLTSWAECNDYAQNFDPNHNSKLGSTNQYILFLAQRIQNGEKWEDICDKVVENATLGFSTSYNTVCTCTAICFWGYNFSKNHGESTISSLSASHQARHKVWQAFVVSDVA